MSEPITLEWLNAKLERKFTMRDGKLLGEWWDCGWRFDNGIGTTQVRVIESGMGFMAEVAQDVIGAEVAWSSGVGLPIRTVGDLRKLCEGVKVKGRLTETPA